MNPSQTPDEIRRRFQLALANGEQPDVQEFVAGLNDEQRQELTRDLLELQADYEHQLLETMEVATDSRSHASASNDSTHGVERTIEDSLGNTPTAANEEKPPAYVGRYEVGRPIGRGGFGSVYLGWDPQLEREVAIKIPRFREKNAEKREQRIAAFLAEARAAVQLEHHKGIVPVYDAGMADNDCYIISQYVAGGSLNERPPEATFSLVEKLRFMATLADTIAFAHDRGWIHRDIKPSNILIDHEGKPYLTDFGLTLRAEEMGKAALIEGTPKYMAPEQARAARGAIQGESINVKIDLRSDIYSLGVVMYGMLTGKVPHSATGLTELLSEVIDEPIAPPHELSGDIPVAVGRICMRALEKDPAKRYQSAAIFRDQLLAQAEAVESASAADFNEQQSSKSGLAIVIACGILLLLLVGLGFWLASGPRDTFIAPGKSNENKNVAMVTDNIEANKNDRAELENEQPKNDTETVNLKNDQPPALSVREPHNESDIIPKTGETIDKRKFDSVGGFADPRGYVGPVGAGQTRAMARPQPEPTYNAAQTYQFRLQQNLTREKYQKVLTEELAKNGNENSVEVLRARVGLLLATPDANMQEIILAVENLKKVAGEDAESLALIHAAETKFLPIQSPRRALPTVIGD